VEPKCSVEDSIGLSDARVIAGEHVGELITGVAGIFRARSEIDIDGVSPRRLLSVAVLIPERAELHRMAALDPRQVVRKA
jgi:hypothetical protein